MKDDDFVSQLVHDYTQAALSDADRVMLDYSAKLTRTPGDMQRDDVDNLRRLGFTDRAILDIAQIVAYYAYVNRIADGLGVALEAYWNASLSDDGHLK